MEENFGELVLLVVIGVVSIRIDVVLMHIDRMLTALAATKVKAHREAKHPHHANPRDMAHPMYLDR